MSVQLVNCYLHVPPPRSAIHWNAGCSGPCPNSSLAEDAGDEEPDDDTGRSHQDLLQPILCGGGGRGAGAAAAGGAAAATSAATATSAWSWAACNGDAARDEEPDTGRSNQDWLQPKLCGGAGRGAGAAAAGAAGAAALSSCESSELRREAEGRC